MNISIPVSRTAKYDILVAGAGVAGIAAAVSAARDGKKVLLIEKSSMVGGLATAGLVNFFVPMCNGRGTKIMGGMVEEFVKLALRYSDNDCPEVWKGYPDHVEGSSVRYMVHYSPQICALELLEFLHDANVDILFEAQALHPVMNGKHCDAVAVATVTGLEFFEAKQFIDVTGNAILLRQAGMKTVTGRNFLSYYAYGSTLATCRKAMEMKSIYKILTTRSGGCANLYGGGHPEGLPLYDGTDSVQVSEYLVRNQRMLLEKLKQDDPADRDIVTLPTMPQFRTICRIDGDFTLQESDAYRHFDDSVCAICDFDRRDYLYEVPFRTLTQQGFDNLITAGRSASGDGYAWDLLRVIPPAILTGQAAALAACMAADRACAIQEIPVGELQSRMSASGSAIHFDDALVPADKSGSGPEHNEE